MNYHSLANNHHFIFFLQRIKSKQFCVLSKQAAIKGSFLVWSFTVHRRAESYVSHHPTSKH